MEVGRRGHETVNRSLQHRVLFMDPSGIFERAHGLSTQG